MTEVEWVIKCKQHMLDNDLKTATATCPYCKTKGSVLFRLADSNNHIRAACGADECSFQMME